MSTIIEMVTHTRLDCVIGSAAGMRRGVAEAVWHARHRSAFGRRLVEQPLMVNVLADLAVESEAATATALRLARAYDEGDHALRRFATAVLKYWICKRATPHAAEALECLGGNGYVEESPMPRLLRDAPLNGIWEGSGNVMSLDVLRALAREPEGLPAFLAECELARGGDRRLDAHLDALAAAGRRVVGPPRDRGPRRSRSRPRCSCGTRLPPSPTRSVPAGWARRAGGCSGRCPAAWTARRSWSGPWPLELPVLRSVQRAEQLGQLALLRDGAGLVDLPQRAAHRHQRQGRDHQCVPPHAVATATARRSWIGRWTMAAARPRAMHSHHMRS